VPASTPPIPSRRAPHQPPIVSPRPMGPRPRLDLRLRQTTRPRPTPVHRSGLRPLHSWLPRRPPRPCGPASSPAAPPAPGPPRRPRCTTWSACCWRARPRCWRASRRRATRPCCPLPARLQTTRAPHCMRWWRAEAAVAAAAAAAAPPPSCPSPRKLPCCRDLLLPLFMSRGQGLSRCGVCPLPLDGAPLCSWAPSCMRNPHRPLQEPLKPASRRAPSLVPPPGTPACPHLLNALAPAPSPGWEANTSTRRPSTLSTAVETPFCANLPTPIAIAAATRAHP
jgi:hypothetical protein